MCFIFPTSIQLHKSCIHLEAPPTEITLPLFIEFVLKAELLHTNEHYTADLLSSIFIVAVCRYSVFNFLVILCPIDCADWPSGGSFCLFQCQKLQEAQVCFCLIFQISDILQHNLISIIFPLSIYSGCPFASLLVVEIKFQVFRHMFTFYQYPQESTSLLNCWLYFYDLNIFIA